MQTVPVSRGSSYKNKPTGKGDALNPETVFAKLGDLLSLPRRGGGVPDANCRLMSLLAGDQQTAVGTESHASERLLSGVDDVRLLVTFANGDSYHHATGEIRHRAGGLIHRQRSILLRGNAEDFLQHRAGPFGTISAFAAAGLSRARREGLFRGAPTGATNAVGHLGGAGDAWRQSLVRQRPTGAATTDTASASGPTPNKRTPGDAHHPDEDAVHM